MYKTKLKQLFVSSINFNTNYYNYPNIPEPDTSNGPRFGTPSTYSQSTAFPDDIDK